jgi:hypothetical protein
LLSQFVTPPPFPCLEEELPEVGPPSDTKRLAKVSVTRAIKNANMDNLDGENFIIDGKTITLKIEGISVLVLRPFNKNG